MRQLLAGAASFLAFTVLCAAAAANEPIAVITGANAPTIEKFAAHELCRYLDKLFGIKTSQTGSIPAGTRQIFLVGSPATNPLIAKSAFGAPTDQGIVLKSVSVGSHEALIVGGGSPRATLWAVYELAEQFGVRFLLHGDTLPAPQFFRMPKIEVTKEPVLRVRQWRVVNEHAMGPVSWGIADYRPFIDQLAKLRFNRLLIYTWPGQPFLPLEYKGVKQTSGTLFFGNRFPVTDDMIGRSLFGNEKEFWNPDLPLPGNPEALRSAAIEHIRNIIAYAHERGMECVMPVNLTEFPREFKPLLAHTQPVDMAGTPTIGPGPDTAVDDPVLEGLAQAVLTTTLQTYPDIDYIVLDLPEWRAWVNQYKVAWQKLDAKYRISEIRTLDAFLSQASSRKNYPGGAERALNEVKADITALYFFDKLLANSHAILQRRKFVISSLAEELFPLLPRILPAGSESLSFVDYTASRVLQRRDVLKNMAASEIPSILIYTLHDDNVGVLPQLSTHTLAQLTDDLRRLGWAGFSTRYWLSGDHEACVAYLARAAWDADTTCDAVYRDHIAHACGELAVADMMNVFREVEAATVALEWHGLGLTFPVPGMMMKHWTPGTLPSELAEVQTHYRSALNAANSAKQRSAGKGQNYIAYWIGRLTFGIDYMSAIEAVRLAATAEAASNREKTISETARAIKLVKSALTSYAEVARDRSDKGAIATMNEFAYRPLRAKLVELKKKSDSPNEPIVRATGFQSTKVYQSKQRPSHTSWVSLFPAGKGDWYLSCQEVTATDPPQPRASKQYVYEMSLPHGYDSSKFLKEQVLLESDSSLKNWTVVARTPIQGSFGSFAQARTKDGRLLRFIWACYSPDPSVKSSDIYYQSSDGGKTWQKMPTFVSGGFAWYPHRLRTLRDGTLVLAAPRAPKWGRDSDYPIRAAMKLDTVSDMEMMLFFSHDEGRTWSNPLPIFSGQTISETDFIELPDGNLLFTNSSIFANPGRQFVYRDGNRFTPGPLERVHSGTVPETVCLTEDGVLVGCQRPGTYYWSNDLGQNWQPLAGAPSTIEVYQPWIVYLGKGKLACAGHYGADDPIKSRDQFISIHTFQVEARVKPAHVKLWAERDYDDAKKRFLNAYSISLKTDNTPLAEKDIHVWYVARNSPGYDSFNSKRLEERMALGGKKIVVRTDSHGIAHLRLPEFDRIEDIHASYQLVISFNTDHKYPEYESVQLPQLEFYANSGLDP
jgi:hypothetical protein